MQKRVMVVDDSAFARKFLKDIIHSDPELTVADTAINGKDAIEKLERVSPDVITLDVEMPLMNGLETLARIMEVRPTPVVMLSSLTTEGADVSMQALSLGAVDIVAKPMARGLPQLQTIADEIRAAVSAAAKVDRAKLGKRLGVSPRRAAKAAPRRLRSGMLMPIVMIASSTGGPRALRYLVPRLPADRGAFYMIVQHLPVGFTAAMARDLNNLTSLTVREAEDGDWPTADTVLIARAGVHSAFDKGGRIVLTEEPPLWGVRPAADIAMTSAGTVFGSRVVGVVLTGMGRDGAHGLSVIRAKGGRTLAEHESSCIIYGMPKMAIEAGAAEKVVPLEEMAEAIGEAIDLVTGTAAA